MILAKFIEAAHTLYGLPRTPIAIGFSNGAIMAAALLLTRLMGRNAPANFYRAGSFSIPDIPHAPARAEDRR